MRTTITLDDDVEAAVASMRREQGIGVSEAVNRLARRGLVAREAPSPYRHRSSDLGIRIDITDIGDVLDLLDEAE